MTGSMSKVDGSEAAAAGGAVLPPALPVCMIALPPHRINYVGGNGHAKAAALSSAHDEFRPSCQRPVARMAPAPPHEPARSRLRSRYLGTPSELPRNRP